MGREGEREDERAERSLSFEEIDGWAAGETEASAMRRYGLMAAALLFAGGIAAIPNNLLHDPPHPPTIYLLVALALVSGTVCLLIPWQRLPRRSLHLVGMVGSIEVLLSVWFGDPIFAWYYIFVVIFAAYAFPTRREVALQLGFACLMMLVPSLVGYDKGQLQLADLVVQVPSLVLAAIVVVALREELERGREAYRFLSRHDPLTGVGNYRQLHQTLIAEVGRHARSQRRFALILVDLDEFKSVNDRLGHLVGDRVLRDVARVLQDSIRPGDTIARHGGDEFSVVAPETSEAEAGSLALRLEGAVPRVVAGDTQLSACSGWAIYPDDGISIDALIAAADDALKREKRTRRPLGETAPEPAPSLASTHPQPRSA
jgi:diguanylate cyclase (GGDEF)-like protein